MKLIAMLRIKNQILTVDDCLNKLSELVDEIIILDNGSTDGTLEKYRAYKKIVKLLTTTGYDEGRDKCLLLDEVKKRRPDWIIWIDGDEVFESSTTRSQIENYMNKSSLNEVKFRMYNFWLSDYKYRVDGMFHKYTAFPQRSMWRNTETAFFRNVPLHNGGIQGISGKRIISPIRLKHYGYKYQSLLTERQRTYGKLSHDKNAAKTLPTTSEGLKTRMFKESKNRILHKIYQTYEYYLWGAYQLLLHYSQLIRSNPSQTKG